MLKQMQLTDTRIFDGVAQVPLDYDLDRIEDLLVQGQHPECHLGVDTGQFQVFLQLYLGYQYCPWTILERPFSNRVPSIPLVHDQETSWFIER